MSTAHYLAYYELHEIPWKLKEPITLMAQPSGILIQLGRGPYVVPRPASPTVTTRAGGAKAAMVNENYVLEGGTYFAIEIPIQGEWPESKMIPMAEWDRLAQLADDAASTISLCLNQRIAIKKLAEYIGETKEEGKPRRMFARAQMFAGARASVSKRSRESIRRALGHILDDPIPPQTLVAIRWYEQSKKATIGADRLVSLWIALEALIGPASHEKLVKKTAELLSRKEFRLELTSDGIIKALGLDHIRQARNDIVHKGTRLVPWPVSDDPTKRDWPQILDDIVGEILRHRLNATLQRTLNKHVKDGLKKSTP